MREAVLAEAAHAKVNLTLRVLGRRPDGYHDIESLVVFAGLADRVTLAPGLPLRLDLRGANGAALGRAEDNLILVAAEALTAQIRGLALGRFTLTKLLPVAAGLGGGSADAAAALRLLARLNGLAAHDPRIFAAACAAGADVSVCVESTSRFMRGIGEILSPPLDIPAFPAVLVNAGGAMPTRDVFAAFDRDPPPPRRPAIHPPAAGEEQQWHGEFAPSRAVLLSHLAQAANDLEPAAMTLSPVIAQVLDELRAQPECRLARMTGSGASCFALADTSRAAAALARRLRGQHRDWWIRETTLGSQWKS
jgi:4-diphosphocytidyl-2-C-methyl-D-erythritol kinase